MPITLRGLRVNLLEVKFVWMKLSAKNRQRFFSSILCEFTLEGN